MNVHPRLNLAGIFLYLAPYGPPQGETGGVQVGAPLAVALTLAVAKNGAGASLDANR